MAAEVLDLRELPAAALASAKSFVNPVTNGRAGGGGGACEQEAAGEQHEAKLATKARDPSRAGVRE